MVRVTGEAVDELDCAPARTRDPRLVRCSLKLATVPSSCSPPMPSSTPAGATWGRRRPTRRGSRRRVACHPVRTCGGAARRRRGRTADAGQRGRGPGHEVDPVGVVAESTSGPVHDDGVGHGVLGPVADAATRKTPSGHHRHAGNFWVDQT